MNNWMKFGLWIAGFIFVVPALVVLLAVFGFFGMFAMVAK